MTEQAIAEKPSGSAPDPVKNEIEQGVFGPALKKAWGFIKGSPPPSIVPKTEESAPSQPAAPAKAETTPESAPEKKTAAPEKAETAPESAPEKEAQEKGDEGAHEGTKAEQRIKQLLSERKRLERELKELRETANKPKAESAPPAARAKALEPPKKPKADDFKQADGQIDWLKFDEAKDKYHEDFAEFKAKQAVEADRQARAQAEIDRQVATKIAEARKTYEDFNEVAVPFLQRVAEQGMPNHIANRWGKSPYGAHVFYVLGGDPQLGEDFLELCKANPDEAYDKFVEIEHSIKETLSKPVKEEKKEEKVADPEPPKPKSEAKPPAPAKPAPKPPVEIGTRGTPPSEQEEQFQAADSGDFHKFRMIEERRKQRKFAR